MKTTVISDTVWFIAELSNLGPTPSSLPQVKDRATLPLEITCRSDTHCSCQLSCLYAMADAGVEEQHEARKLVEHETHEPVRGHSFNSMTYGNNAHASFEVELTCTGDLAAAFPLHAWEQVNCTLLK